MVHAERIYTNNSGTHYAIIIRFKKNAYYPHMLARTGDNLYESTSHWLKLVRDLPDRLSEELGGQAHLARYVH